MIHRSLLCVFVVKLVYFWCVCAAKTECVSLCVCVSPFSRPYLARVWPVTSSQVPEELMFPSGLVGPSSLLNTPTESSLDHNFSHTHTHTQKDTEGGRKQSQTLTFMQTVASSSSVSRMHLGFFVKRWNLARYHRGNLDRPLFPC